MAATVGTLTPCACRVTVNVAMPIPAEKLSEAKRPLHERILEFLRRNKGTAYTIHEVIQAMEYANLPALYALYVPDESRKEVVERYTGALAELKQTKMIEIADYQGNTYFTAC